jgi:histidinol-phosphate aminotransferase
MSRFWSPVVHKLDPYVPGEQPKIANLIKLNTNENPYGPSPKALEAIRFSTSDQLRLYPDPDSTRLKETIAGYYDVETTNVFIGNGSDEVLAHVFNTFFKHEKPILFPDITYSFYPVYCGLYSIDYKKIALNDDFEIILSEYSMENGGIIFPNPNAPTGRVLSLDKIETLLKTNTNSVVVVDEAYIDFGGQTAISLVNQYPNLLVTQTLSKSRSLAALRIGFAVGDEALIEGLVRVKDSFNSYPVDTLAANAAIQAFEDEAYFDKTCQKVMHDRDWMTSEMMALGFKVLPSAANFIFVTHPKNDASEIAAGLRKQGIIVRHFMHERINQYLRISVGTTTENQLLLAALDTLVD